MCPGFTHWESGEVCPYDHEPDASNEDVHLYYRKFLVPLESTEGGSLWGYLTSAENAGKWGHLPLAPK